MPRSSDSSDRPNRRPARPGRKTVDQDGSKPRADRRRTPWKHGYVPVLGLVGGIGAGKSVVAARLAERGALVLDADAIGHTLLDQKPSREEAVTRFGDEILDPSDPSKINRRVLGTIVFEAPESLRALERILHPRMRRTFEKAIARAARQRNYKAVVLDAAVLYEAGWNDLCDLVAFVDAPREIRLERLQKSRGWTDAQLAEREAVQLPLDLKRRRSDRTVTNSGNPEQLEQELEELWRAVRFRPRTRPGSSGRGQGASVRDPKT